MTQPSRDARPDTDRLHPHRSLLRAAWLVVFGLMLTAVPAADADAVKLNNIWTDVTDLIGIEDGALVYANRFGNQTRTPLEDVEGLRIDDIPELEQGQNQLADGEPDNAVRSFEQALRKTGRTEWLQQYVRFQLVLAHDRAGEFRGAFQNYFALVRAQADGFFLQNPPLRSVGEADAQNKSEAADRLEGFARRLRGESRDAVASYAKALQGDRKAAEAVSASAAATGGVEIPDDAADPDLVLPEAVPRDDEITILLLQAKYEDALAKANEHLRVSSEKMAEKLYQRGMAQMGLARAADGDLTRYKDAGLSFMRLIVWRPKSIYVEPSLLELGAIHAAIGRPAKARELYDDASLAFDSENEPELYERLQKLIGELPEPGE